MSRPKDTTATVIPGLRYQDAPKAIDWLCRAFGFEKRLVVPGEGDSIAHAQLTYGNGMIMLGSAGTHGGSFDDLLRTPAELGGANTQAPYVIVDDCKAHYERARVPAPRSCWTSRTRTTAAAATPAATPRATSGASATTIPGRSDCRGAPASYSSRSWSR